MPPVCCRPMRRQTHTAVSVVTRRAPLSVTPDTLRVFIVLRYRRRAIIKRDDFSVQAYARNKCTRRFASRRVNNDGFRLPRNPIAAAKSREIDERERRRRRQSRTEVVKFKIRRLYPSTSNAVTPDDVLPDSSDAPERNCTRMSRAGSSAILSQAARTRK